MRLFRYQLACGVFLIVSAMFSACAARAADVIVFAAASLTDALSAIAASYQAKTGHTASISFAASSLLARQIAASQGADVFISADTEWMDFLEKRGLVQHQTRRNLLKGRLVLIAPNDAPVRLRIAPHFDIRGALHGGRLALADPESVPAGKYAKAALVRLGVWNRVADQLAPSDNVRTALAYVAQGDAPLGIVYETDAKAEVSVRVVDRFPDNSYPEILYAAALAKDAGPYAKEFLNYLESAEASSQFLRRGFNTLRGEKPEPH